MTLEVEITCYMWGLTRSGNVIKKKQYKYKNTPWEKLSSQQHLLKIFQQTITGIEAWTVYKANLKNDTVYFKNLLN